MRSPIDPSFPLIKIAVACIILGLVAASLMRGWIIIQVPLSFSSQQTRVPAEQRTCSLWLYKDANWHTDKESCLFPDDTASALKNLISSWVTLVNEEKVTPHPLKLTSALVSDEHIAYLSFEQSPFSAEQSTYDRWLFVESLLRTIKDNVPQITSVMLLVNHKPLADRCLDLSTSWPIQGFLES